MIIFYPKSAIAILAVTMGLAACAATHLSSISKDPGYDFRMKRRALVIALVRKPANQRLLEDEFVRRLKKRGNDGTASYTLVREGEKLDEAAWKRLVADNHFESVIVSRLIDFDVTEKDVDAKYLVRGGGNGYGYYNAGYGVVYQPGFTLRKETAAVETRVFDVAEEKMVWSARSKTDIEQGRDPEAQIRDFVRLMMSKIYG